MTDFPSPFDAELSQVDDRTNDAKANHRYTSSIEKRALDIGAAVVLIAVFILPWIILAAINKTTLGKVIYTQKRIGRDGVPFNVLKFQSMVAGADEKLEAYLASNPAARAEWAKYQKLKDDPRVTRFGRFIRKTSLDETPQLFNVLFGSMSMVGPRPIVPDEAEKWGHHIEAYKACKPGITGEWQVFHRSNEKTYDIRCTLQSKYLRDGSVWKDLKYIALTTLVVVLPQNAV
jgi:undecaprenyl-phosphate galactose phosphotransferase